MLTSVALLLVIVGEVSTDLRGDTTCTTTAAIDGAVEPRVPLEVPLHLAVTVTATTTEVRVELALDIAGTSTATRQLDIIRGDCPLLPRLVASVAERYVTALPKRDWAAFRRARRMQVIRPREGPPIGAVVEPSTPVLWWIGGDVGVAVGANAPRVHVDLRSHVGARSGVAGAVAIGSAAVVAAPIGDGVLDLFSVYGAIGPAWTIDLGAWVLHPRVLAAGGIYVGRGRNFDAASTTILPLFDVVADLAVRIDGFHVALGAVVAVVRPQFERASTTDVYDEPLVRLMLSLGWSTAVVEW